MCSTVASPVCIPTSSAPGFPFLRNLCNIFLWICLCCLLCGSVFMALLLKCILTDMSIGTPAFFSCPFAWKICFQPFTLSLCRSFVLRWVSCRQHMCGSCFLIHSAILCLLIGSFNQFTFKVIIDRYLFIANFSYLCSSCFLFSFLSLKQSL